MGAERKRLTGAIISSLLIFAVDYLIGPGYGLWLPYLLPLIFISDGSKKQTYTVAGMISVLMVGGHFLPPAPLPPISTDLNRAAGIAAIWVASILLVRSATGHRHAMLNRLKLQRLIETLPVGVVIADSRGEIVLVNAVAQSVFCGAVTGTAFGPEGKYTLHRLDGSLLMPGELPLSRALKYKEDIRGMLILVRCERGSERVLSVDAAPISYETPFQTGAVAVLSDVTDRTHAESERERLLAEFEATVRALPDGFIIYNPDTTIRFMNEVAQALLGYDEEDLRRPFEKRAQTVIVSDLEGKTVPRERYPFVRALKGEAVRGEVLRTRVGDKTYWLSMSAAPIKTAAGHIQGATMDFSDITDLITLQQSLAESEERFRSMFESHQAVMLLIDPETGEIRDANNAAAAFYGFSRECLRGMRIQEINRLAPSRVKEEMQASVNGKEPYHLFQHRLADGRVRWVEVYSSPVHIQNRRLLFSIIHDTTVRKRAQEQLAQERNFVNAVIQTQGALTAVLDTEGRIVRFNRAAELLTGYTFDEIRGRSVFDLFILPE
ncbi:MAG: PAS domain S-box protein, partial [Chitinivibrionales bacterium]|nr:PAS domain S-box protein [Chitinivibrionales bacterium]MBD3356876.1 PAS domain S-box protein [Chitinivibrionales bacterium]